MARTTTPNAATQFKARGYLIGEDAEMALRDVANGLDALAQLCEDRGGYMPEIPPAHWAGLLRTFSRQTDTIRTGAGFANEAMCEKRIDD